MDPAGTTKELKRDEAASLPPDSKTRTHFIHGQFRESGGKLLDVYRPAEGDVLARVPIGTEADIDAAVASAERGFRAWSAQAPSRKERVLGDIARAIESERHSLAEIERANTGKRLTTALQEIDGAAEVFSFYAGYPTKNFGQHIPTGEGGMLCYTLLEPIGVVGVITPWNYPLLILAGKVAAALAAGCAVVAKPAPETPLTALELARLASDCGLGAGVFNVVTGDGTTGGALPHHPGIAKVSFTGSTATGRKVLTAAGENGRPVTLELGGKSPNLVFGDVDLAANMDLILTGALANAGQECCAGARILVEEQVFDQFVDLAAERVRALRVGDDEQAEIGPLISRRQHERVSGFVERALGDGATIRARAEAPEVGFYFSPTLLVDVSPEMEVCREEIFGPVITVLAFSDDDQAITMANDTRYGLAAGVWTSSIDRSIRLARDLEAGQVWVNSYLAGDAAAPFGGNKDSGFGRELGLEGPKEFSQIKTVYVGAPNTA